MILNYSYEYLHHTCFIPTLYPLCACSVPALYMLHTHSIPAPYPLHTHTIPTPYPHHTCSVPTPYPLHTHTVPTPYMLCAHSVHTPYLLHTEPPEPLFPYPSFYPTPVEVMEDTFLKFLFYHFHKEFKNTVFHV